MSGLTHISAPFAIGTWRLLFTWWLSAPSPNGCGRWWQHGPFALTSLQTAGLLTKTFKLLTSDSGHQGKGIQTLVLLVIWSLWKERNNRIFKQQELSSPRFIAMLRDEVRTWIFAGAKHLDSLVGSIFIE